MPGTRTIAIGAAILMLWSAGTSAATGPAGATLTTDRGVFVIAYESELDPLRINTMHTWTLTLTSPTGRPVTGAEIDVSGGMPDHDHGLPTAPRVTDEPQPGSYVLEGLRFHMTGSWEIVVDISAGSDQDRVTIPLVL